MPDQYINLPEAARQAAPDKQAPLRVLLLDDDIFLLDVLSDMLSQLGRFDIAAESDSRRAIATLHSHQPQLLICDLSMPDMDGIEFLHVAAEAGYRGGVALLSGMDSSVRMAAERLASVGGLHILGAYPKPLQRADLQHLLARLGQPRQQENAP